MLVKINGLFRQIPFVLGGLFLAAASFTPETGISPLFALAAAASLAWGAEESSRLKTGFLLFGLVFHGVAFYWLAETVHLFGGFPWMISYAIFALFCLTASLQFVLCAWIFERLRARFSDSLGVALAASWLCADLILPRMFPWAIGHSLVKISQVASIAEWTGVPPLSAFVIYLGSLTAFVFLKVLKKDASGRVGLGDLRLRLVVGCSSMAIVLVVGAFLNFRANRALEIANSVRLGLIQGNLDVRQKGDVRRLDVNLDRYRELSRKAVDEGAEVLFWPETVMIAWTPDRLSSVRDTAYDPFPESRVPLLYGSLGYAKRDEGELQQLLSAYPEFDTPELRESLEYFRYNSAFAIDSNGAVLGRYHKRALMPFGEYLPFSDRYPELKLISPQTGDFSVGPLSEPVTIPLEDQSGKQIRAALLICYEDLVPALSREAVQKGANLLVNLTNDAWYGDTAAPYQHHLLAQWRAIESRRYLIRVTNTGYTAVVNSLGRTVADLPLFEASYLVREVKLMDGETLYSTIGDTPAWIICGLTLLLAFLGKRKSRAVRQ